MKLRYFLVVVEDIDLKIKRQKSRLLFFFFFKKNGLLFNTNLSCVLQYLGKHSVGMILMITPQIFQ